MGIRGCKPLPKSKAAFNRLYNNYHHFANRRNIVFNLNKEEFKELTEKPCHYCGELPNNTQRGEGRAGDYIYSGIDRVDNSKGYDANNVVSCCFACNRAKDTRRQDEFISWAHRVVEHLTGI